jgi:hypothetical protein
MCTPLRAKIENLQALIASRTGCDHRDAWATKINLILQNYRSYNCESIEAGAEVSPVDEILKNLTANQLT